MIEILIILIAYSKQLWWLVFVGVAVDALITYFQFRKLEQRIEELENENLHR